MHTKPEWTVMYKELIGQHCSLDASDLYPYEIEIQHSWHASWDDEIDWCLDNLPMDSWRWRYTPDTSPHGRQDVHVMFSFADEADRVLFMLTWSNSIRR